MQIHSLTGCSAATRVANSARKFFQTPLIFSIHEAKGLEYENIILYRFISDNRDAYSDICQDVTAADLTISALEYRRARDKGDKTFEVYKSFVNALYVALIRAIKNVYIVESDTQHPLLRCGKRLFHGQ